MIDSTRLNESASLESSYLHLLKTNESFARLRETTLLTFYFTCCKYKRFCNFLFLFPYLFRIYDIINFTYVLSWC